MIKNLPFNLKDLEVHIQKMIVRISTLFSRADAVEGRVETLEGDLEALEEKQDKEKRIYCIATQRTTNTNPYAELPAADDQFALATTDNRRRLNFLSTNDATYYELVNSNTATAYVRIKKPGKYSIKFTSVCHRTGVSTYCYLVSFDPVSTISHRFDRPGNVVLSSAAGTAGNVIVAGGSVQIEFASGTREISLWHFFGTRTVGFNYGRFGIQQNTYTDTCSIEIELIEDL